MKEYAKMQEGSVCVFDKRGLNEGNSAFKNVIQFPNKKESVQELESCQKEVL